MPSTTAPISLDELATNIQLLLGLLSEGSLHETVVRQVVKGACWWVSNAHGKRDACPLWSEAAAKIRSGNTSWLAEHDLIHEHLVPRNFIEEQIIYLNKPTVELIKTLLELSIVCIVTAEEDALLRKKILRDRMPKNWSLGDDILARYLSVGIKLRSENGKDPINVKRKT